MRELTLYLPDPAPDAKAGMAGWLQHQIDAHPMVQVARAGDYRTAIAMGDWCHPLAPRGSGGDGLVHIAPGISLTPTDGAVLQSFLQSHGLGIDHIGVNISDRDIDVAGWERLIATAAQAWPAYRLDIGSRNDIVILVEDRSGAGVSVLELVYDRVIAGSSMHVCLTVEADRALLEACFPAPFGAYKPGDEPFFRSVAPPQSLPLPVYIDLAFTDGAMVPWMDLAHAMGNRIR